MAPSYSSGTLLLGGDAPYPSPSYANSIPTSPSLASPQRASFPLTSAPQQPKPASSTSTSTSTFPLFTSLPPELRLKIWHLTLPSPRLVPLTYQSSTAPLTPSTPKSHRGCTSPAALSITLRINHESRTLALQHYSLAFGLSGGLAWPGARPGSLPSKIYFSAARRDVLFFGRKRNGEHGGGGNGNGNGCGGGQDGLQDFVNACMMVHPGASGFGQVTRLAVPKGLFTSPAGTAKGVSEMRLRLFWERVLGKFVGVEEVLFVERGEDALGAFEGEAEGVEAGVGRIEEHSWGRSQMEGVCYADDGLGFNCWEEESLEEKVERVVRSVEAECGLVAPRWRVLGPQEESLGARMEEIVIDRQRRKEKEEALVRQMRELFGHEDILNAL